MDFFSSLFKANPKDEKNNKSASVGQSMDEAKIKAENRGGKHNIKHKGGKTRRRNNRKRRSSLFRKRKNYFF